MHHPFSWVIQSGYVKRLDFDIFHIGVVDWNFSIVFIVILCTFTPFLWKLLIFREITLFHLTKYFKLTYVCCFIINIQVDRVFYFNFFFYGIHFESSYKLCSTHVLNLPYPFDCIDHTRRVMIISIPPHSSLKNFKQKLFVCKVGRIGWWTLNRFERDQVLDTSHREPQT